MSTAAVVIVLVTFWLLALVAWVLLKLRQPRLPYPRATPSGEREHRHRAA